MAKDQNTPITPQQRVMITHYALTGKIRESMRVAGYSTTMTDLNARKILFRPNVQRAYQEIIARPLDEIQANMLRIVRENSYVAFSDLGECFDQEGNVLPIHEMSPAARRSVSSMKITRNYKRDKDGESEMEVTREIKLWSKPQALEMFFKYHEKIQEVMDKEIGIGTNNRKEFTIERLLAEGIKQGILHSSKMGKDGNGDGKEQKALPDNGGEPGEPAGASGE